MPSLILQPLVENAIQHGIAASARAGALTIRARREDGFLLLEVRDTGPGLARESAGTGQGIGLANTRAAPAAACTASARSSSCSRMAASS